MCSLSQACNLWFLVTCNKQMWLANYRNTYVRCNRNGYMHFEFDEYSSSTMFGMRWSRFRSDFRTDATSWAAHLSMLYRFGRERLLSRCRKENKRLTWTVWFLDLVGHAGSSKYTWSVSMLSGKTQSSKAVGRTQSTSRPRTTLVTICSCSDFIVTYPNFCMALVATLWISLSYTSSLHIRLVLIALASLITFLGLSCNLIGLQL